MLACRCAADAAEHWKRLGVTVCWLVDWAIDDLCSQTVVADHTVGIEEEGMAGLSPLLCPISFAFVAWELLIVKHLCTCLRSRSINFNVLS